MRWFLGLALVLCACRTQPFLAEDPGPIHDLANALPGVDLAMNDDMPLVGARLVRLDQASLGKAGDWRSTTLDEEQTITVGLDGGLVGIECVLVENNSQGAVVLTVSDEARTVDFGSASVDASVALPFSAEEPTTVLTADMIGGGYFDFSATPIPVAAGQHLRFRLSGADVMVASAWTATNGGMNYQGGDEYVLGEVIHDEDLLFKTFVAN